MTLLHRVISFLRWYPWRSEYDLIRWREGDWLPWRASDWGKDWLGRWTMKEAPDGTQIAK